MRSLPSAILQWQEDIWTRNVQILTKTISQIGMRHVRKREVWDERRTTEKI